MLTDMKQLMTMVLLALCSVCCAQEAKPEPTPLSKLEEFSKKSGTLVQKTFESIGGVSDVTMDIVEIKDLLSNQAVKGLRMELVVKSTYSTDTKRAFLDSDEIDGLLKSIQFVRDNVMTTTPTIYTEVTYQSRSGFEFGAFFAIKGKGWTSYLKLERFDGKSFAFMDSTALGKFLELISLGKAKM